LHGYFDALRAENAILGIDVSLMCLGPVVSEILDHVVKADATKKEESESRMPTDRCTDLIARGMYHKVDELWISDQPLLFVTFLNTYAPWIGRQLLKYKVGPSRVRMLTEGGDMYSMKAVFTSK
jgi:short-subunit dehydrogenase